MKHIKNMVSEFTNLDSKVKKLFTDFFFHENPLLMVNEAKWQPNIDIYETSNGLIIKMELAGARQKDIDITYDKNSLIIKGERHDYSVPDRVQCRQIEINYGEFERKIFIEENLDYTIDSDNIRATYKNGMLFIFVPYIKKIQSNKSIKIKIDEE